MVLLMVNEHAFAMNTYDFPALVNRIRQDQHLSGIVETAIIDNWVSSQKADGSWDVFDYGKLNVSQPNDNQHLYRLWHIAAAASRQGHARYDNAGYKNSVKNGLDFWQKSGTVDPNWWYNRIYFPQKLGEILIFMREFAGFIPLTSAYDISEEKIIALFQPVEINHITSHGLGANAIDIAQHYIYRGILTANGTLLEQTRNHLEPGLIANIQADDLYHDHGPQVQISSYGWVFANGLMRIASYLSGTPAAFNVSSDSFGKVIRFIRDTQISSVRGTSWDFSVMGRAVSRVNALNGNLNYIQRIIDFNIDPDNKKVYEDALLRVRGGMPATYNVRSFNKHFWSSDYTQHSRNGFLFTVRNVSKRTVEAESGNGENLRGNYFSYGATFISVDGNEYKNIMPFWDWSMIPGSTFPHTTSFPVRQNWGVNYGTTTFVGGVSDGEYGASVLDFSKSSTQAKKSWFFFENEIVCLGAGITSTSGLNVRTTINQPLMETPAYILEKGATTEKMNTVSSALYSNNNLHYIRQSKVAYYFHQPSAIKYTMKTQSGRWSDINTSGPTAEQSGYVFTLWVDHGVNPVNDTYSYVVVPGINTEAKAKSYNLADLEIVQNTPAVQAVYHKMLDLLQIVFHQATTLVHNNVSVTVNRPCVLMLRNGTLVTIADPAQTHSVIQVNINSGGIEFQKYISLPTTHKMNGSSVTVNFNIPVNTTPSDKIMNQGFSFYPNPVKDKLYLNTKNENPLHYELFDLQGKMIMKGVFDESRQLDLSGLTPGFFMILVNDGIHHYREKIIRQ
jgi:chondroitin AC lyase